jgi:DNA-binding HxlR family transcriptional regulator
MADCGLDTVLALIGGKWKMLILYHLSHALGGSASFEACFQASGRRC